MYCKLYLLFDSGLALSLAIYVFSFLLFLWPTLRFFLPQLSLQQGPTRNWYTYSCSTFSSSLFTFSLLLYRHHSVLRALTPSLLKVVEPRKLASFAVLFIRVTLPTFSLFWDCLLF